MIVKKYNTILNIKGLSKTYKRTHFFKKIKKEALKNVNLKIKENEIFALIGLNGSGKTTTLKLLLGLLSPDSGYFNIFGKNKVSRSVKEKIGFLPEIPSYNTNFTPMEILKFWGHLSGIKKEDLSQRIAYVLKFTSLHRDSKRKIDEFSRGMRQRLGIAQAILSNPDLLILDEPMGGLDPQGIIDIRALIRNLKNDGKTIFFTSHLISEVEKIADRVGILHQGNILDIVEPTPGLEKKFLDIIKRNDLP